MVALRALGERTRMRIVRLLLETPLDIRELAESLGVSQSNTSKHLRVLREAGLLSVHKERRLHRYALSHTVHPQATAGVVLDLSFCQFQLNRSQRSRGRRHRTKRE